MLGKKKGQTLIEVTVALGILAIVFAGTITLIVGVVNLSFSARNRTEAIALAQMKLAETASSILTGCNKTFPASTPRTRESGTIYHYRVDVNTLAGSFSAVYDNDLNHNNFAEIVVTVDWTNKGLPDENYVIKQIVRK